MNRLNLPNKRTELVSGVLVLREPAGYLHGDVAARLLLAIGNHVLEHGLGRVFAPETGFTLARKLDTVRAPDVAFISSERLPIRRLVDSPRWHRISPSRCRPPTTARPKSWKRSPTG